MTPSTLLILTVCKTGVIWASYVLTLASRGRLTLSNTVPLSRTLLKPSFKSWIPWGKKVWRSRTIEKGWFRQVIQLLVQTGTSNRSSCVTRAEHVYNYDRGQIADANFWSKLISVKKLLMSSLNLAWKFDVSIESRAKHEGSKGQNILRCWDWKRLQHAPILLSSFMLHEKPCLKISRSKIGNFPLMHVDKLNKTAWNVRFIGKRKYHTWKKDNATLFWSIARLHVLSPYFRTL